MNIPTQATYGNQLNHILNDFISRNDASRGTGLSQTRSTRLPSTTSTPPAAPVGEPVDEDGDGIIDNRSFSSFGNTTAESTFLLNADGTAFVGRYVVIVRTNVDGTFNIAYGGMERQVLYMPRDGERKQLTHNVENLEEIQERQRAATFNSNEVRYDEDGDGNLHRVIISEDETEEEKKHSNEGIGDALLGDDSKKEDEPPIDDEKEDEPPIDDDEDILPPDDDNTGRTPPGYHHGHSDEGLPEDMEVDMPGDDDADTPIDTPPSDPVLSEPEAVDNTTSEDPDDERAVVGDPGVGDGTDPDALGEGVTGDPNTLNLKNLVDPVGQHEVNISGHLGTKSNDIEDAKIMASIFEFIKGNIGKGGVDPFKNPLVPLAIICSSYIANISV